MAILSQQLKPAFQIESATQNGDGVNVNWKDGHQSHYHNLWLKDACRCPQCFQYDTLSVNAANDPITMSLDPQPISVQVDSDGNLAVGWDGQNGCEASIFDASWLRAHCYTEMSKRHNHQLWDSSLEIPQFDYEGVVNDDDELFAWLNAVQKVGVTIIDNAPTDGDESNLLAVTDRIGILRARHHPTSIYTLDTTDEIAKEIQSSYKLDRVPPHTDYTPYEDSWLTQFLYCLKYETDAKGRDGYSTVVDGFKVAQIFKDEHPEHYAQLVEGYVPTCRRRMRVEEDGGASITKYQLDLYRLNNIIDLDEYGEFRQVRYKHNTRAPFDMPHDKIRDFYVAYKAFANLVEEPSYSKEFLLKPGQMLAFNNARILHGRNEISDHVRRLVIGSYVKGETSRSRWRMLLGQQSGLEGLWLTGCSDNALQLLANRYA